MAEDLDRISSCKIVSRKFLQRSEHIGCRLIDAGKQIGPRNSYF